MTNPNSEDKIIFQQLIQRWQLSKSSLSLLIGEYTPIRDKSDKFFNSFNDDIKQKLLTIKVYCNCYNHCYILSDLIKQRAYYLAVYLTNSTESQLVGNQVVQIVQLLSKLNIQNPDRLYYYFEEVDYQQHLYNYYQKSSNILLYVGAWNSRKNIKIGEYLIEALQLDKNKISPEKLLDLLEDPLDEIVKEFKDNGLDVSLSKSDTGENSITDDYLEYEDEIQENQVDWHEQESEPDYYQDDIDDDDYDYYSNSDPYDGVDWGDPSTFNQAAWDQFRDD
ncbi:hypothetical protein [Geminocystis sp. GBBB08]|uniref:hypothetical protein n=1 Tax=Geminocystis sp. GBBB08 TaxID=2604140 RepID=UPI0027E2A488|nr:hypothetical protein [Geminocystis sp. GBBB08]MBL1208879.1 hypothetical protein [Geminocystis sp. GBBB08]